MILVVGATGLLGGMITRQLLQQGHKVRILIRHNSPVAELAKQGLGTPAQTLIAAGAQPVYGDLKDWASLDPACSGVETVITTANTALRGGEDTIESVDLHGTQSLIEAAKDAGVRHFIYTSAAGVQLDHPHPFFQAKAINEAYLRESGLAYTILKPGVFMEVWIGAVVGIPLQAGQPVTLVGQGNCPQPFVSVGDVAAYAVTAVTHPAACNKAILIGGSKAHSWTEVVETVSQTVGQPIPIQYVPPGETVPLIPETMSPIMSGMESQDLTIDMSETAVAFGIQPTPLAAFAQRFFGVTAT